MAATAQAPNIQKLDNENFIREKKARFADHLERSLRKRKQLITGEVSAALEQIRQRSPAEFTAYIVSELCPYKNNLPAFVTKMCTDWGIQAGLFDPDEHALVIRYLECFLAIVG